MENVIQLFNLRVDDKTQDELQKMLKPFIKNNYREIFNDKTLFEKFNQGLKNEIAYSTYFTAE